MTRRKKRDRGVPKKPGGAMDGTSVDEAAAQPPQLPEQLQLAPVPIQYAISIGSDGSQTWVLLTVRTPVGESTYFVLPEFAQEWGEKLNQAGVHAKTGGLVLPSGVTA